MEVIGSKTVRPFSELANLKCRSYSFRLQKAIVDFGADVSFLEAQKKMKEHYNLEIPLSSLQAIVKTHAQQVSAFIENDKSKLKIGNAAQLIAEMDGSMVPIVETAMGKDSQDNRRCKSIKWREARLCLARDITKVTPFFYATMGDVERAGNLLHRAASRAGLGFRTKVHGVGDGAKWIEDQMKRVFRKNVIYLIDFYHVSEYLAEAAEYGWTSEKEKWRRENEDLLKRSKAEEVLERIKLRLPLDWENIKRDKEGEENPIEKCYRYLNNRKDCLDYRRALAENLPIGSGEIESSHRYIIQKRLKIAGAWWREDVAESMLNLRVLRANNDWDDYWEKRKAA